MKFKVTDAVNAEPMLRGAYCQLRGWGLPDGENGDDEGYLVERRLEGVEPNHEAYDGHITWMPKALFDRTYTTDAMDFGRALDMLRIGKAVARGGWNGKRMFLYLVPAGNYPARTPVAKAHWGDEGLVPYGPYIAMKTATGEVVPWLASQTDVLAHDWSIVGDTHE